MLDLPCDAVEKSARRSALLRQCERLERRLSALARLSNQYAWIRLAIFLSGVALTSAAFVLGNWWLGLTVLVLSLVVFDIAARLHRRVKSSAESHRVWLKIKQEHIARMNLDWEHIPPALFQPERPLELDLDLVGERSLHRLCDTATSREGSTRLRDWLSAGTPDLARIEQRQSLVRELISMPVFRDKLRLHALLSSRSSSRRWDGGRLMKWLAQFEPPLGLRTRLWILTALAIIDAVLFLATQFVGLPPFWGFPFVLYAGIYLWTVQQMGDPFNLALSLSDPLNDLHAVFRHLETYPYTAKPGLRSLCALFLRTDQRPSALLRRLSRVVSAASLRRNPLLWTMFSSVLPWDVYVMHALNKRRAELSDLLPRWLDVWFELEALASLASAAYLNPDTTFPRLHTVDDQPILTASGLGHPLIPNASRVCNDFTLFHLGEIALITGSNMSGKSTFLRTLGVNLCLAYAGGTVYARQLDSAAFRLFSCIRVTDSVTDGISYFYAEVKCLKAMLVALEEDHPFPLFFLVDEIFRGTNNRERLIGSRSYIRALVGKDGAGVLSTHDLELVKLAGEMPQIKNYHFAETISGTEMSFDYTLRSGPCPTTNALKIMQMQGLPVDLGISE